MVVVNRCVHRHRARRNKIADLAGIHRDVYGSLNCGMDVVWIETERQDWMPPEVQVPTCKPTYTVRSISEVIPLLQGLAQKTRDSEPFPSS